MAEACARKSPGSLVAAVLAGAWHRSPPALQSSAAELAEITPRLLGSGAAALGWWRVRHSGLRISPPALQLQQAYRLHTLHAALHERAIKQIILLLRSAGVEPVLAKGWAVARLYPEKGLRPYGDIDLYVQPEQYASAEAVLKSPEGKKCPVDLHQGFRNLGEQCPNEWYTRSQLVRLAEVDVRVLCAEDHFRVLCLHLLRHGAWRPLWLCDIAVALESRATDFDWDDCLGRDRRCADWIACTIGLAHQLFGTPVDGTPVARRAKQLPSWLVPNVLKQWETPYPINQAPMKYRAPMEAYLRHPAGVLKDLANRWPNPIEATIGMGGPFNEWPRLLFQVGHCLARTAKFLTQTPKLLREREWGVWKGEV